MMKKTIIIGILLASFITSNIWANDVNNFKSRLNKVRSFHASFTQTVKDGHGNVVQEGLGDLWVKRPNLFNWHMIQPEESVLVSDGDVLWLYNPCIEQVIVNWLKDVIDNTPFILFMHNNSSDWQQYNIKQTGDNFKLTLRNNNSNLKQFIINISSNGVINYFSTIEQDDRCISYQLTYHDNSVIDISKFTFIPSSKVTVDDQRN